MFDIVLALIESSSMATLNAEIENVAKSSVATANQEILKELVNVIKRVESDSSFANAVARELGLVFSSSMFIMFSLILQLDFMMLSTIILFYNIISSSFYLLLLK